MSMVCIHVSQYSVVISHGSQDEILGPSHAGVYT